MFQNIHGVLTVKKILHKQTERYRLNQSFVLEVAKVEQVPIQDDAFSTANDRKFSTNRGAGPTHYEYTVSMPLAPRSVKRCARANRQK